MDPFKSLPRDSFLNNVDVSSTFFGKFQFVYSLSLMGWNGIGVVSLVIDSSVSGVNLRL